MTDSSTPNPSDPASAPRLKLRQSGAPANGTPAGPPAAPAEGLPPEPPVELSEERDLAQPADGEPEVPESRRPRQGLLRLALILIPGLLLAGMLLLLYYVLQPIAGTLEPIAPATVPLAARPITLDSPAGSGETLPADTDAGSEPPTVEAFLERLAGLERVASANPRGVFINAVFFPEETILNPALGLIVERVEWGDEGAWLHLRAGDGRRHRIAVEPPE